MDNRWTTSVRRLQLASLVLAGIALFFSAAGAAGETVDSIVIEPDFVLGAADEDAEYFFGGVGAVVEDSHGNVYVGDYRLNTIFKFSPEAELLISMNSVGSGPGDIMPHFSMAIDKNDNIYLAGQGGRVAILDTSLSYVASFTRSNPAYGANSIGVFPDGSIAIAALNLGEHTTVNLYSPSHEFVSSFSETFAAGSSVPWQVEGTYANGQIAISGDGALLYLQFAPFLVRKFTEVGALIGETSAGGAEFVPAPPMPEEQGDRVFFKMTSGTTGIAPVGEGGILTSAFSREPGPDARGLLCLYDDNLVLVGRRELPRIESVVGVASGGRVYIQRRGENGVSIIRANVRCVKS